MLLSDYPGPKAPLYYQGDARPHWCCDTVEMFNTVLKPEQARPIRAVLVQDMALADWEHPRGHWFDARTGWYVLSDAFVYLTSNAAGAPPALTCRVTFPK